MMPPDAISDPGSGRSYYEEGSIASRLRQMEAQKTTRTHSDDPLQSYRQAAAVLVAFRMDGLAPIQGHALDAAVRRSLRSESVPSPYLQEKERFPLTLMLSSRKKALQQLRTRAALKTAITANPERPSIFLQQLFIDAVEGRLFHLKALSVKELIALATVSDWLEGTEPGQSLPIPSMIRSEVEQRRDAAALRRLASDSFTGREKESALISQHLASSAAKLLVVHGPGGTGKSALISQVLLDWTDDEKEGAQENLARPKHTWVRVDLDHSLVQPDHPNTILQEAAAQLMRQHPELETIFADFIRDAGATEGRRDYSQFESTASEDISDDRLIHNFAAALRYVVDAPQGAIAFWIDTFEEAQFLGSSVVSRLVHLLLLLARELPSARVIVSGRAPLDQAPDGKSAEEVFAVLPLADLPPAAARELLSKLVIKSGKSQEPLAEELLTKAAKAIGGNPLSLRLAAPLLAVERNTSVSGLAALTLEVLQRRLYSRFEPHIRNPDVRKLVMPGLIVRRITPDVIQHVLAGPCELGPVNEIRARALLDEFAKEVTLIEKESDELLRHRQDVRLVMLAGMPTELKATARRIDENAIRYWMTQTGPVAIAEQLYHRLRLGQSRAILTRHWQPQAGPLLRSALEELPRGSVQRAWLATNLKATLESSEAVKIDQVEWEQQTGLEVGRCLADGKPEIALDLLRRRKERLPGSHLYALESRACLLAGKVTRARIVAWEGITRNREPHKEVAVDLALFVAHLEERARRFGEAGEAIALARHLADESGDQVLQLASGLRALRLHRVEGRSTEPHLETILAASARSIGPNLLASRPALLREVAAELGEADADLLRWATDVLLDELLRPLSADESLGLLRIANSITAEEDLSLRTAHAAERHRIVKHRLEERLYASGPELESLRRRLQGLLQQSVDAILHQEFAVQQAVRATLPPAGATAGQPPPNSKFRKQLELVIAQLPEEILHRIARYQLSTDLSRLSRRKGAPETAAQIVQHSIRLGRLRDLVSEVQTASGPSQATQKLQRLAQPFGLLTPTAGTASADVSGIVKAPNIFVVASSTRQDQRSTMSRKKPLHSLLTDTAVMNEIRGLTPTLETARHAAGGEFLDRLVEGQATAVTPGNYTRAEAIILLTGRPALLIQDGSWERPESKEIRTRLSAAEAALKRAIPKVGRVEILDFTLDYVGTGWMIDEDLLMTNRHVAEVFAEKRGQVLSFRADPDGRLYRARVDFLREHDRSGISQAAIKEIIHLEDPSDLRPDMALVRLDKDSGVLPPPIELDSAAIKFRDQIAVIGYPAEDPRNDAFAMRDIFKDVFNVKRLSPGMISGVRGDGKLLEHDCTTLGGNSGSLLVNLATGKACGLHFAGSYRESNYAVTAAWLKSRLADIGQHFIPVLEIPSADWVERRRMPVPELTDRQGYNPKFLGEDGFEVRLPEIDEVFEEKIAPVKGRSDGELKYSHFSIRMRADRRLPFYTACNIDGASLFSFVRGSDRWLLDPRLENPDHQVGESLYANNPLDRGHLVRRLDPVWGETRAEAKRAEEDTFFFTNCTPQHSRLNQRIWLSLEDYVLGNAATHDLKVTVFTGPVLRDSDREYRGVLLPEEFWKVVVIVNSFTNQLSATGYILSQADYIADLEFVYGEFRTYQVPIRQIEQKVNLHFDLSSYDPLGRTEAKPQREVRWPSDLVL
jgi:DNA/RNA endonuclease G (NUC1)